jgi:hypothetical protein
MTLHETKPHETSTALTVQQHHTKAAEHLELAAKSHKEVAKLIGANHHAAAQALIKVAKQHVVKAQDHVTEAGQKPAPMDK